MNETLEQEPGWMILPLWIISGTLIYLALKVGKISQTLLNIYLQINP